MSRIAVIGSSGAGKSTLSRLLGEALHTEVIHLDRLYWQPGWIGMPHPEWEALQQELVSREAWIIDGNYGGTMQIRLARAEAVVFLDYSPWVCLWGVCKRRWQYRGRGRPDMNPGCPEQLDWEHLKWIWAFPRDGRVRLEAKLAQLPPEIPVYRLRSRRETETFLAQVRATGNLPI